MLKYPIIAIVGDLGSGKTLTMTSIGLDYYYHDNFNLYANYHLKNVPYTYREFSDLANFPEHVKNGVLLMDEGHVDGDAYNFMRRGVRDMGRFITQIRKRKLILIYTTQDFGSIFLRLRELTNYLIETTAINTKGLTNIRVYDRKEGYLLLKEGTYDLSPNFKNYDTKEVI